MDITTLKKQNRLIRKWWKSLERGDRKVKGLSRVMVCRICNGARVTPESAKKLAAAMKVSARLLVDEKYIIKEER